MVYNGDETTEGNWEVVEGGMSVAQADTCAIE